MTAIHKTVWAMELRQCLGLLTRLPIPVETPSSGAVFTRACRWFPLTGALVGLFSAAVMWLGVFLSIPNSAVALIAVGASILLTGALHEDGLADVADGFGGGGDQTAKLAIMRDSRVGTYGVLALVLAVGLKWSLVAGLMGMGIVYAAVGMVVAAAASRLAPVLLLRTLPAARQDGLAVFAGRPEPEAVRVACAIAIASLLLLPAWPPMLGTCAAVVAGSWAVGTLARRQIGGQTGDVLGAGQQVTEILVLLALVVAG